MFYSEEDIQAMYDAAEFSLNAQINKANPDILVVDERQPAKLHAIQRVARAMVDSIVRGSSLTEYDDITSIPGIEVDNADQAYSART